MASGHEAPNRAGGAGGGEAVEPTVDPLPQVTWVAQRKKGSRLAWVQFAVLGLILVETAFLALGGQTGGALDVLLPLAALWLVVAVHELGHVLAARLVGFRFVMVYIWPFRIARQPRGLRLSLRVGWQLPGFALCLPVEEGNLLAKLAVYDVGGVGANLLLAGVAGAIASVRGFGYGTFLGFGVWPTMVPGTGFSIADTFILTTEFMALTVGLLNLLPVKVGGVRSDGLHLVRAIRAGEAFDQEYAHWLLRGADLARGLRPRDWDPDLMRLALGSGWEERATLWHEAYCWSLDRGDLAGARQHLERAFRTFEGTRRPVPAQLLSEMAYFEARYLGDAASARARLSATPPATGFCCFKLRAQAAMLLAEQEARSAGEHARAALKPVDVEALEGGRTTQAMEWLQELITESEAQAGVSVR
jgi:hypothetical protein